MSSDSDAKRSEFYINVTEWINTGYANIIIKNPSSGLEYDNVS